MNNKRRKFAISTSLIWTTPIIQSVALPAHAQTSMNAILSNGADTISVNDTSDSENSVVGGDVNAVSGDNNTLTNIDSDNSVITDPDNTVNSVNSANGVDTTVLAAEALSD